MQWHCCIGHPSLSILKRQVMNLRNVFFLECEPYQLNKHHRMSFLLRTISCVSSLFEIVHSNVRGPINIFHNKIQYFVTFVDDYSCITWFFLMKNCFELLFMI